MKIHVSLVALIILTVGSLLLGSAVALRAAQTDPEPSAAFTSVHAGGPDAYGYVYDTVPANWTDIAATGTRVAFSTQDDATRYVSMPQTFWLYDVGTNGINVSTNGYTSLRSSTIYTGCNAALRQPPHALAPFCADLTVSGGNVYYESTTFNGHPVFIIQYQDVLHKASGLRATFQIILDFADNSIAYQYLSTPAGGAGAAVVGLIGSALNAADFLLACAGDAACQPTAGLALRFYLPPRPTLALGLTPSDDFPQPGATLDYTLTLRNTGNLAAPAAAMTNSLPIGLDYTGGLAATAGVATYDADSREVRWRGDLDAGAIVTLTYAAALNTADPVYATAILTHPLAAAPATALAAPADPWSAPEVVAVPHFFDDTLASARHLAVDAAGGAHVAYGGNGLFYATRPAGGGAWLTETIVTTPTVRPALLLDGADRPVIAFAADGKLMLARAEATEVATTNGDGAAGWQVETIADGPALRSELARASDGRLHLVYEHNGDLYYTTEGAGGWSAPTAVITSTGCTTYAGFSLALDAADAPHVACAYRSSGNLRDLRLFRGDGATPWPAPEVLASNTERKDYDTPSLVFAGGEFHLAFARSMAEIYYGRKTGGAWQITQIAQGGALYDSYASLAVRGDSVAVAYAFHNLPGPDYPTDIRLAQQPLAGGAWTTAAVESFASGRDLPYPALALDATGRGHLAYYDGADETLRYAAQAAAATSLVVRHSSPLPDAPTAFTFETVDHAEVLRAAALAVGDDATVHLAYLARGLRYAAQPAGGTGWAPQVVLPEANGSWLDLAVDAGGAPHAVYAGTGGPLHYAAGPAVTYQLSACGSVPAPAAPQAWTTTIVDQPGALQSSPAVAADAAARPHIAYLALAADGGRLLRHAALNAGLWGTETVATIGNATGVVPPPEIVTLGDRVYLLYADCTAATATGTYPIPLRLAQSDGAGWQTQTVDTFYGACNTELVIRLRAAETGGLVAVADLFSFSMRPPTFRRTYTLSATGQVMNAATAAQNNPVRTSADEEHSQIEPAISDPAGLAGLAAPLGPGGMQVFSAAGLVGTRNGGLEYIQYHYSGAKYTTYQVTKNGTTYTSASVPVYQWPGSIMTGMGPIHRNGLGRGGGIAAVTETFYGDPAGTGTVQIQITPPRQPPGCQIQTKQEFVSPAPSNTPAPTTAATCAVDPAGSTPCDCGKGIQTVSALDRPTCCGACGWNFYEWKGSCAGATGRNPTTNAACPTAGACDAIAVWHRPLLGVSSTPTQSDFCASKQNSDKGAMSFELCASSLDDWTVSALTFQAAGSGKDDQEIEKVKLTFDGKTLEGKYTADDGTVVFTVGTEIAKGQCKAGSLTYTLKQLTCPLCDDPVGKTGCAEEKEFAVTLPAENVAAAAKSYPHHLVTGSATGGPLTLQCVKNTNTSKYFYELQKAVDDGATQNGHTIEVCPGTYTENVNVTKELRIRSTDGRGLTTVQAAAANDHVFEVSRNNTTIQGFTIRGATGANKAGVYLGSAAGAAAPVTLSGLTTDDALGRDASEESRAAERDASAPTPGLSMTGVAAGVKDCKVLGNALQGNRYGVFLDGASKIQVGGTTAAERNVISGNSGDGVRIAGAGATENKVLGNRIGTDAAGAGSAGNSGSGVWIGDGAHKNTVGGTDVIPGTACDKSCNVIANNLVDGVTVLAGTGNAIQGNAIYGNTKLGIDLGGDGWTRNGKTGGAAPNNWQNYPAITGTLTLATSTVVTGSLTARANTTYRLEFFTNSACEATSLIQGRELIATTNVTTDANGQVKINTTLPRAAQILTVTATDPEGNTSEFSPPDIQITAVEVTQAIQNLANDMRLIKAKETYVRVYVRAAVCNVPNVTARLTGPGGQILNPLNAPIVAEVLPGQALRPTMDERDRLEKSLYFRLPRDWRQQDYEVTATVNPDEDRPDSFIANNEWKKDLVFVDTQKIYLVFHMIHYNAGGLDRTAVKHIAQLLPQFLNVYPIADENRKIYWDGPTIEVTWPVVTERPDMERVLQEIQKQQSRWWDDNNTFRVGIFHQDVPLGVGDGTRGFAFRPGNQAAVKQRSSLSGTGITLAHEVGHNLGLAHIPCGVADGTGGAWALARVGYPNDCWIGQGTRDGYFGFDTRRPKINVRQPDQWRDMMGYGDNRWISDFSYNRLYNRVRLVGTATPAQQQGERFLVMGAITPTLPAGHIESVFLSDNHTYINTDLDGPYTLEVQNAIGQVLASDSFGLPLVQGPEDRAAEAREESGMGYFGLMLPYHADATRIVLKHNATVLHTRTASPHRPTVKLTAPQPGATMTETLTVSWTSGDDDGDALLYEVLYSADAGTTWRPLGIDLTETSLTVDASALPGGNACLVRVAASDGFHTARDTLAGYLVSTRKPPTATIWRPLDGERYLSERWVILQGQAYDQDRSFLEGADLVWTSDRDGLLGTGEEVEPQIISPGWHTITLTAADSNGMNGSASVRVCVGCVSAELSLSKQAAPAQGQVGRPLTYTLVIANAGPDAATGVVLTDTLPAGVTVGAVTISQGTCNVTAGVAVCNVGQMAAGATVTATIVVTPTRPGALTNQATVRCSEADATFDNAAAVMTEVAAAPRLYLPVIVK